HTALRRRTSIHIRSCIQEVYKIGETPGAVSAVRLVSVELHAVQYAPELQSMRAGREAEVVLLIESVGGPLDFRGDIGVVSRDAVTWRDAGKRGSRNRWHTRDRRKARRI